MYKLTFFIVAICISCSLMGQEISSILTTPKVGVSGGINIGGDWYSADGRNDRRSPFSYSIGGNIQLKAGAFTLPASFVYRDQKFSGNATYGRFGISPYYKWVKLHLGHRTMRFNEYSLQGKLFFGAGIELTPGDFRFSAVRGSIKNHLAQRDTIVYGADLIPTYKRNMTGVKVGFGGNNHFIDFIYLHIKDDPSEEFDENSLFNTDLDPAENLVLGTSFGTRLFRKLRFKVNLNASGYTENSNLEEILNEGESYPFLRDRLTTNLSTKFSAAGDAKLSLGFNRGSVGLKYQRIEPNYRSLGMPFIQADRQNYTLTGNLMLFNQRLNLSGQGGIETNNLRNLDLYTRERLILNLSANLRVTDELMIGGNFSNFQFQSQDGLVELNDTLRYVQVNQTKGINISYNKRGENFRWGIFAGYQKLDVLDRSPVQNISGDIYSSNMNLGLKFDWVNIGFMVRPSLIYASYSLPDRDQTRYGGGVKLRKKLMEKKMTLTYSTRYVYNDIDDLRNGNVFTNRLSMRYKINDKYGLTLSTSHIDKQANVGTSYSELRTSARATMRF